MSSNPAGEDRHHRQEHRMSLGRKDGKKRSALVPTIMRMAGGEKTSP